MKTTKVHLGPEVTPEEFCQARKNAGLTQRESSHMIFGPDSYRTVQNWETGTRRAPRGLYVLFLLMTGQMTLKEAHQLVQEIRVVEMKQ